MMDCATIILGILHEDSPLNFVQIDDKVELADWLYEDIEIAFKYLEKMGYITKTKDEYAITAKGRDALPS